MEYFNGKLPVRGRIWKKSTWKICMQSGAVPRILILNFGIGNHGLTRNNTISFNTYTFHCQTTICKSRGSHNFIPKHQQYSLDWITPTTMEQNTRYSQSCGELPEEINSDVTALHVHQLQCCVLTSLPLLVHWLYGCIFHRRTQSLVLVQSLHMFKPSITLSQSK